MKNLSINTKNDEASNRVNLYSQTENNQSNNNENKGFQSVKFTNRKFNTEINFIKSKKYLAFLFS